MSESPHATVTVTLDGRPVSAYHRAFASGGRIFAPLRPYVTRLADRVWFDGNTLVIQRDGRSVRVTMLAREPDALDAAYVPLAAVARALGASVEYRAGLVQLRTPPQPPVASPTPFDPAAQQQVPRVVFTPVAVPTPRPVWTGSGLPRRTPLPYTSPKP